MDCIAATLWKGRWFVYTRMTHALYGRWRWTHSLILGYTSRPIPRWIVKPPLGRDYSDVTVNLVSLLFHSNWNQAHVRYYTTCRGVALLLHVYRWNQTQAVCQLYKFTGVSEEVIEVIRQVCLMMDIHSLVSIVRDYSYVFQTLKVIMLQCCLWSTVPHMLFL